MTPAPTLLQEWEAFYQEFKNSTTYALATSNAARLLPSLIDDADADEDRKMSECDASQLPTNSNAGLRRLRHSVRELEKANIQLAKFVDSLTTPTPCQPTLRTIDNNLPQPCSDPQRDTPPQYISTMAPPPAPNPAASYSTKPLATPAPRQPTLCTTANNLPPKQYFAPQRDNRPTEPLPAPNPQACPLPECRTTPRNNQSTVPGTLHLTPPTAKPTIPNWARPAVPPPAGSSPMEGVICTGNPHWPPPRPERKTIPFKKKSLTKPAADNRKDFLRPP